MSGWRIEVLKAHDVLDRLYAFRYRIYVEEMARPQKYADHGTKRIRDPLDDIGYNIVAWDSGEVAGCIRVNLCRDGALDYYNRLFQLEGLGAEHPVATSVCTRLMVAPRHRSSSLATRLSCAAFDLGLDHGIIWNFIDCNDHLVGFFGRLGYQITHMAIHEEYGRVNVMRLNIRDHAHLKTIGSVFRKHLERYYRRSHSADVSFQQPIFKRQAVAQGAL
jgi:hypothetical protein